MDLSRLWTKNHQVLLSCPSVTHSSPTSTASFTHTHFVRGFCPTFPDAPGLGTSTRRSVDVTFQISDFKVFHLSIYVFTFSVFTKCRGSDATKTRGFPSVVS